MDEDVAKLLSLVDILEPLSREELRDLSRRVPEIRFERGQLLYTPTYAARVLFLLLAGRVRLYKVAGGRELTLDVVGSGRAFGEVPSSGKPQGAYAEALEPSRVALLGSATFENLLKARPEVGLKMVEAFGERAHLCEDRLVDVALKEVPARLAGLLARLLRSEGVVTGEGHYKIPTRYTHEELGAMIGAKRVAVSRAFAKLRRGGVVKLRRRQVHVTDPEALEQIAKG